MNINDEEGQSNPNNKRSAIRQIRAEAFFNYVQESIDNSNWSPAEQKRGTLLLSKQDYRNLSDFGFTRTDVDNAIDDLIEAGKIKATLKSGIVRPHRTPIGYVRSRGESLICLSVIENAEGNNDKRS